jgi:hypothetical protein
MRLIQGYPQDLPLTSTTPFGSWATLAQARINRLHPSARGWIIKTAPTSGGVYKTPSNPRVDTTGGVRAMATLAQEDETFSDFVQIQNIVYAWLLENVENRSCIEDYEVPAVITTGGATRSPALRLTVDHPECGSHAWTAVRLRHQRVGDEASLSAFRRIKEAKLTRHTEVSDHWEKMAGLHREYRDANAGEEVHKGLVLNNIIESLSSDFDPFRVRLFSSATPLRELRPEDLRDKLIYFEKHTLKETKQQGEQVYASPVGHAELSTVGGRTQGAPPRTLKDIAATCACSEEKARQRPTTSRASTSTIIHRYEPGVYWQDQRIYPKHKPDSSGV